MSDHCPPPIEVTPDEFTYLLRVAEKQRAVRDRDIPKLEQLMADQKAINLATDMGYDDCPLCVANRARDEDGE